MTQLCPILDQFPYKSFITADARWARMTKIFSFPSLYFSRWLQSFSLFCRPLLFPVCCPCCTWQLSLPRSKVTHFSKVLNNSEEGPPELGNPLIFSSIPSAWQTFHISTCMETGGRSGSIVLDHLHELYTSLIYGYPCAGPCHVNFKSNVKTETK